MPSVTIVKGLKGWTVVILLFLRLGHALGACDPSTSVADWRMQTYTGKLCFFPFKDGGVTYTDCQAKSGKTWCPTSCNYPANPAQWDYCRWTKAQLAKTGCSGLPNASASVEPMTSTGRPCIFPFILDGTCYSDCTLESSADGNAWCPNAGFYANDSKSSCVYDKSLLTSEPSCVNLSSSKPSAEPEVYGGNDPGAQCHFPFYFEDVCHNDCQTDDDTGQLWCSTQKSFSPANKRVFCKHLKNYKTITSPIPVGFYRIFATDGKQLRYSTSQNTSDGHPLLVLEDPAASSASGDQMWEVVPMPESKTILRTPHRCPSPGLFNWALAIDSGSTIVVADRATKRYEWQLTRIGTSDSYKVESTHVDHEFEYLAWRTVGSAVQATTSSSHTSGAVTFNWRFAQVPDGDYIFAISNCSATTTTSTTTATMTTTTTTTSPTTTTTETTTPTPTTTTITTTTPTPTTTTITTSPTTTTASATSASSTATTKSTSAEIKSSTSPTQSETPTVSITLKAANAPSNNNAILGGVLGGVGAAAVLASAAAAAVYFFKRKNLSLSRVGGSTATLVNNAKDLTSPRSCEDGPNLEYDPSERYEYGGAENPVGRSEFENDGLTPVSDC